MNLDQIILHNNPKPFEDSGIEEGNNAPAIDLAWAIKVSVQGFEYQVFAGLKESIKVQKFEHDMTKH